MGTDFSPVFTETHIIHHHHHHQHHHHHHQQQQQTSSTAPIMSCPGHRTGQSQNWVIYLMIFTASTGFLNVLLRGNIPMAVTNNHSRQYKFSQSASVFCLRMKPHNGPEYHRNTFHRFSKNYCIYDL